MAPKGEVAAQAKSKEPNDWYDSLNQDAKDICDEIGTLGFKAEVGIGKLLFARQIGKDPKDALGPAESLEALRSMVKEDVARYGRPDADEAIDIENLPPSDRLPGMEEPVIEELDRYADKCIDLRTKRDNAVSAYDDACDEMRLKMHDHSRMTYKRRGYPFVIQESEKLVMKKQEHQAPKHPTVKNPDPVLSQL